LFLCDDVGGDDGVLFYGDFPYLYLWLINIRIS